MDYNWNHIVARYLFGKDLILIVSEMKKRSFENSKLLVYRNPSSKGRELKNRLEQDDEFGLLGGYSYFGHEDYSYIDFYKKAFENVKVPSWKKHYFSELVYYETHRNYHEGSFKEFKALKQIGPPDHELNEAKWDLFKISMSDIVRNSVSGKMQCKLN